MLHTILDLVNNVGAASLEGVSPPLQPGAYFGRTFFFCIPGGLLAAAGYSLFYLAAYG